MKDCFAQYKNNVALLAQLYISASPLQGMVDCSTNATMYKAYLTLFYILAAKWLLLHVIIRLIYNLPKLMKGWNFQLRHKESSLRTNKLGVCWQQSE